MKTIANSTTTRYHYHNWRVLAELGRMGQKPCGPTTVIGRLVFMCSQQTGLT